ncbi:MAG: hypothetical protein AAB838_02530 [Patescibacteria group bacterium]
MAIEINLLPDKKKDLSPDVESGLIRVRKVAVIVLFLVLMVAGGTFAYGQALLAQKSSLETKIENLGKAITSLKEKEIVLVLLKEKVAGIKTVLGVRRDISKEMSFIQTLVPVDAQILGFDIDNKGLYKLDLKTKDSGVLDTLIAAFKNSKYKNVVINDLSGNVSEGYKFKLTFNI